MSIRLRFTNDAGIMPAVIRSYCWSSWNHCEIWLPSGYLGSDTGSYKDRDRIIPPGVQIRPLDYRKPRKQAFATIDCSDLVTGRVLRYAKWQIGKPYDYSCIFGMATHRDWRDPDKWVCSELVAAIFEQAGMPLLNPVMAVNRVTPKDISISPYLVYEE